MHWQLRDWHSVVMILKCLIYIVQLLAPYAQLGFISVSLQLEMTVVVILRNNLVSLIVTKCTEYKHGYAEFQILALVYS